MKRAFVLLAACACAPQPTAPPTRALDVPADAGAAPVRIVDSECRAAREAAAASEILQHLYGDVMVLRLATSFREHRDVERTARALGATWAEPVVVLEIELLREPREPRDEAKHVAHSASTHLLAALAPHVVAGSLDTVVKDGDVAIGEPVAKERRLKVGDALRFRTGRVDPETQAPEEEQANVGAIVRYPAEAIALMGRKMVLFSLERARAVARLGKDDATGVAVTLGHDADAEAFASALRGKLSGGAYNVLSRTELDAGFRAEVERLRADCAR